MYNLNFKKKQPSRSMVVKNDENTLYFDFFLPKINEGYDLHFFKDKGLTFINKDRE